MKNRPKGWSFSERVASYRGSATREVVIPWWDLERFAVASFFGLVWAATAVLIVVTCPWLYWPLALVAALVAWVTGRYALACCLNQTRISLTGCTFEKTERPIRCVSDVRFALSDIECVAVETQVLEESVSHAVVAQFADGTTTELWVAHGVWRRNEACFVAEVVARSCGVRSFDATSEHLSR